MRGRLRVLSRDAVVFRCPHGHIGLVYHHRDLHPVCPGCDALIRVPSQLSPKALGYRLYVLWMDVRY